MYFLCLINTHSRETWIPAALFKPYSQIIIEIYPVLYTNTHTHTLTCGVCRVEAFALHRSVGDEAEVNPVPRGDEGFGKLAAAETTQDGRLVRVAVEGLQVIVGTLLVLLDLELVK